MKNTQVKPQAEPVMICAECARERGYRWPRLGSVAEKIARCEYCGKRSVLFDRDDLVPPGADDDSEEMFE